MSFWSSSALPLLLHHSPTLALMHHAASNNHQQLRVGPLYSSPGWSQLTFLLQVELFYSIYILFAI